MQVHDCKKLEEITSMKSELQHHAVTLHEFKSVIEKVNNNLQKIYFTILALLISFISATLAYLIK